MDKSSQNDFIVNLLNVDWPLFSCLDRALQTKENNPCTNVARVMPKKANSLATRLCDNGFSNLKAKNSILNAKTQFQTKKT